MHRLVVAKSTRKIKKQTKQMEEPATYHDIRDMFKAGRQGKGNNTKTAIEIDALYFINIHIFFTRRIFIRKWASKTLKL